MLPMIYQLQAPCGAQAKFTLHGAHVLSWQPANQSEQLFLSKKSSFKKGDAIRGGIPIIFPQFSGLGTLPKHGFARNLEWQLVDNDGAHSTISAHQITLQLTDNEVTRALWPHAFLAQVTIALQNDALQVTLSITNTGETSFSFTAALHTYFQVQDIQKTTVQGLQGRLYKNSATGQDDCLETNATIQIEAEVDRIYKNAPLQVTLQEPDHRVTVFNDNFKDTVVWNPWAEGGAKIADLEPQGYQRFVCIEAAAIVEPITLQPQQTWQASQRMVSVIG